MPTKDEIITALKVALPVMLGYVGIGIPCGIMEEQIGMNAFMAFVMSMTLYSGAGQFMIPNLWIAGNPLASIIASVSFVNTRQMLYSAAFSPFFKNVSKRLTFWFAATVTDESFGVNMEQYQKGGWSAEQATLVNLSCRLSWAVSNAIGVLVGSALSLPIAIAAFAMTGIFICLLIGQLNSKINFAVAAIAFVAVCVFKSIGLSGLAILLGAICGVVGGLLILAVKKA